MKSDGDLVSITPFEQENGKSNLPAYFSSSFQTCATENLYFDSLAVSEKTRMMPCKQISKAGAEDSSQDSSPGSAHYNKASDSNGNDIRTDKNLNNSLCGSADADKTDVSHLTTQVTELQRSLSSLQAETDNTITKLKQELQDKANIVETLQQQIRMKMFMNMTREKGLQQPPANPMMAALADMQGNPQAQIGRGGLGNTDNFGILNEEMLASWRKNLEQSLLAGFTFAPTEHGRTPGSPRSETPHTDRHTPLDSFNHTPDPKSPSDDGNLSPNRSEASASPAKIEDGISPNPSPVPISFATPTLVPKSFANIINTSGGCNTNLSVPPLFTSRIPKGDPLEERLHDMLRYNMEKFAGQPIDTLADSRRVRELLSVHNIGQRLFAKYVLGLSQGTVSELLSKPKSWDKLTEKGRDSYRKMHAWVWDDQAILLLKTLIPRKGELLRSASSIKQEADREDRNSEHRINKILSEVNKSHDNFLPKFPSFEPNPQVSQSLLLPNLPTHPKPQHGVPGSGPGSEDLKLALSFYQAEINHLQKLPNSEHSEMDGQPLSEDSDKESLRDLEKENQDTKEDINKTSPGGPFSMLQAQLDQSIIGGIRPNMSPHPVFPNPPFGLAGVENPLQRMANITNSLVSQPLPSPHFGQRPLKAILPPITQQQFDHFSHLNTDETVRRTKEILSQYSISQRLFGEAVLGLSQGSVSDLLARPKPWHMLTQKGREPFIRMKLFLDDETAIHKLVASQYKIVPEKLLRQGAYSGAPILPPTPKLTTSHPRLAEPFRAISEAGSALSGSPGLPALIPNSVNRLPHQILPNLDRSLLSNLPSALAAQRPLLPSLPPHLTPNLYEMAALTQEFDTLAITNKVKELLIAHNTGQKLFGEAVLGLSQGSVSELLSKPKPWHMLSIKGREPFIRMQLWLNDPNNIDKLLAIKKLQEESRKRKRPYDENFSGKSSPSDISDLYSNPGLPGSPGENESKRTRESGLDLSFKREGEDEMSEGEQMAGPEEEGREETEVESDDGGNSRQNYQGGGRSRRKPVAPQWLNPEWSEEVAGAEGGTQPGRESLTINGVCVMNTAAVFKPEQDKPEEWEKSGED